MTASCCNGIIGRRQLSRALSDGRKIGADGRYPVGRTVDVANATYKNTISVPLLSACWQIQIGASSLSSGSASSDLSTGVIHAHWRGYDRRNWGFSLSPWRSLMVPD